MPGLSSISRGCSRALVGLPMVLSLAVLVVDDPADLLGVASLATRLAFLILEENLAIALQVLLRQARPAPAIQFPSDLER